MIFIPSLVSCCFPGRLILVTALSPACGDTAPCCLWRRPPAASPPPPPPPSRWAFWEMFTVAREVSGFSVCTHAGMVWLCKYWLVCLCCVFRRATGWERSWQRWRPSETSCAGRWTRCRNTSTAAQTTCPRTSCRGTKVRRHTSTTLFKDDLVVKISGLFWSGKQIGTLSREVADCCSDDPAGNKA